MPEPTRTYLDFERSVAELETRIADLEKMSGAERGINVDQEIAKLKEKAADQLKKTYAGLDAWQKTQVARHPERPHFGDFLNGLFTEFTALAGDRNFGEDHAIIGGPGRFRGRPCLVIGHEKGRDTESRIRHNFGMARPEGYRKAIRLMDMAERFDLPVISLVDTAGAYPGLGAEERGQAEAIARSIDRCLSLRVPMVAVITGEGGSGGAIAIAAANRVLMLEHSIYSVISPEGCASILWQDRAKNREAALAMRITATDLLERRIVDGVIEEPPGGAHRDVALAVERVGDAVEASLNALDGLDEKGLIRQRRERFLAIGRMEAS
jgi:acetyl-CoA carboxylase carboxyl transferase subunit alpha